MPYTAERNMASDVHDSQSSTVSTSFLAFLLFTHFNLITTCFYHCTRSWHSFLLPCNSFFQYQGNFYWVFYGKWSSCVQVCIAVGCFVELMHCYIYLFVHVWLQIADGIDWGKFNVMMFRILYKCHDYLQNHLHVNLIYHIDMIWIHIKKYSLYLFDSV